MLFFVFWDSKLIIFGLFYSCVNKTSNFIKKKNIGNDKKEDINSTYEKQTLTTLLNADLIRSIVAVMLLESERRRGQSCELWQFRKGRKRNAERKTEGNRRDGEKVSQVCNRDAIQSMLTG